MFAIKQNNLLALVAGAFISLSAPVLASAATISISPSQVNGSVGKTFVAQVVVDGSESYNAASAVVTYDSSLLSVSGVNLSGSPFSLPAGQPKQGDGTVEINVGNISALTGHNWVAKITFKPKKEGSGEIGFGTASVLSADGSGADVLKDKVSTKVTIAAGAATPKPTSSAADTSASSDSESSGKGDLPEAPFINSKTNPKPDEYSGGDSAKFDWDLPPDVTAVAVDVSGSSTTIPTTKYDPAIADKEFHGMTEGENWVHVRFKNSSGWGKVAHRKFLYDKTPPLPFEVTASSSPESINALLFFSATDTLSGIARYEYSLNGGAAKSISLVELKNGSYPISALVNGSNGIKVAAFDKAGNKTEAEVAIMITAVPKADAGSGEEKTTTTTSGWAIFLAAAFALAAGILAGTLWKERKTFKDEKFLAKREADETRDRVAAVFGALREETRDRLGELAQKPNPSALDREVSKRMNDALDLSEELIEKEVEDVRKLLSH